MKKSFTLFFFLVVSSGCITYYVNEKYLSGSWTDLIPKDNVGYFAYEHTEIRFEKDSFFLYNMRVTDNYGGDTCPLYSGHEYAAGRYLAVSDLLYLNGSWTDKTYKTAKNKGCYNTGKLSTVFRTDMIHRDQMELFLADSTQIFKTGIQKHLILFRK